MKTLKLTKANSNLRKETLELKDKYTSLESKFEEISKSSSEELEEKKNLEKAIDDLLRKNQIMKRKIQNLEDQNRGSQEQISQIEEYFDNLKSPKSMGLSYTRKSKNTPKERQSHVLSPKFSIVKYYYYGLQGHMRFEYK